MARPESDVDIRGIAIPTLEYFHGFVNVFHQYEAEYPRNVFVGSKTILEKLEGMVGRVITSDEKLDSTIYGLRKFFKLAADCNPNIIEFLYADPCCHVLTTSYSDTLIQNRDLFLSAKAKFTFSGYAHSQLKRIRTHRKWLIDPPTHKPTREEFRLALRTVIPKDQLQAAESLIKKKVNSWILLDEEVPRDILEIIRKATITSISEIWEATSMMPPLDNDGGFDRNRLEQAAGKLLGFDDNFLEYLDRERRYKAALQQYKQYENWKATRNKARAKLEAHYGYDTKHAAHLVRLMRMAKEILSTGNVIVRRPDAEELLEIRNGAWSFDKLMSWADSAEHELDIIYKSGNSPLPKRPNQKALDNLCISLIERALSEGTMELK